MRTRIIIAAAAVIGMTACTGLGSGRSVPFAGDAARESFFQPDAGAVSVLETLKSQVTIGSTVDPLNHDVNPYGLTVATASQGKVKKGDLFVCNFNAASNKQGTGTTIVALSPKPGSKPQRFAQSSKLLGCAALTQTLDGAVTYAASFGAAKGNVTQWMPTGAAGRTFNKGLVHPWGATWAISSGIYTYATTALYVSDASTGSIVLAEQCTGGGNCLYPGIPIIKGFPVNHGKPGSILGPSGLAFDATNCVLIDGRKSCGTLYVVDGANNTIVAIHNVTGLHSAGSIVVGKGGTSFGGPDGSWASVVYSGKPLNGPISSALFYNHNLVVGNTLDPNGKNLLIEIEPPKCTAVPCKLGTYLYQKNVDTHTAGALFGIVATGKTASSTKLYFNDDNANDLEVLQP